MTIRTTKEIALSKTVDSPTSEFKTRLIEVAEEEGSGKQRISIEFPADGGKKVMTIDRSRLSNAADFKRELMGQGAAGIADYAREADHLVNSIPERKVTLVQRAVWEGSAFTNRFGTFGQTEGGTVMFAPQSHAYHKREDGNALKRADALAYLREIDEILVYSPIMMLSFFAPLLPPLLTFLGEKSSFSIVLSGQSTTGKSLASRVAHSVSARASDDTCLDSFNMTHGRVGDMSAYSGSLMAFKDIKGSQAKERELVRVIQTLIVGVADGSKRQRLDQAPAIPPEAIIFVMSMEQSLSDLFERNGVPFQNGERVRVLELNVAPSAKGGIFDLAPHDARKLAEKTEAILTKYHGVFLPYWVNIISKNREIIGDRYEKNIEKFFELAGENSAIERRCLKNLAMVYGVASLIRGALMPQSHDLMDDHFRRLVQLALKPIREADSALNTQIEVARRLLKSTSFPLAKFGEDIDPEIARDGFQRKDEGQMRLYVKKSFVDRHLDSTMLPRVLEELEQLGILVGGKAGLTRTVKQAGLSKQRYLKIRLSKL